MTSEINYSVSHKFEKFINEVYQDSIEKLGQLEKFIVTKINVTVLNPTLQKTINKIKTNKEIISKSLYAVAAFYIYSKNYTFFLSGVGVGFITSSPIAFLNIPTLRAGELLTHNEEDNFFSTKVMVVLALLNAGSKENSCNTIFLSFLRFVHLLYRI